MSGQNTLDGLPLSPRGDRNTCNLLKILVAKRDRTGDFEWLFRRKPTIRRGTEKLEMYKFVPKLLALQQKVRRVACCRDWLEVIIKDESWFYEFDMELKSQSKDESKQNNETAKIKVQCLLYSLTLGALFTRNFRSLQTEISTLKFCGRCRAYVDPIQQNFNSSWLQCACLHAARCVWVFGLQLNHGDKSPALFAWFSPLQLPCFLKM